MPLVNDVEHEYFQYARNFDYSSVMLYSSIQHQSFVENSDGSMTVTNVIVKKPKAGQAEDQLTWMGGVDLKDGGSFADIRVSLRDVLRVAMLYKGTNQMYQDAMSMTTWKPVLVQIAGLISTAIEQPTSNVPTPTTAF